MDAIPQILCTLYIVQCTRIIQNVVAAKTNARNFSQESKERE